MSEGNKRVSMLIRVGDPLIRVKMTFRPLDPAEGPVTDGPLIRVGDPLIRVKMTFKPVEPTTPDPADGAAPADRPAELADIDPAG